MPVSSRRRVAFFAAAAAAAALSLIMPPATAAPGELADSGGITVRNGAGVSNAAVRSDGASAAARTRLGGGNGISYRGGPVMTQLPTNAYYIWYGNWAGNSGTAILSDLIGGLSGSPYFNINTTYYDAAGAKVKNSVALAGSTTDGYSQGTVLSDAGVQAVVSRAITGGALPKDTNAVYFVLTSADVDESSGFLTKYCGWHTHATISSSDIKYSFVGDPSRGMSACAAQTVGPNGNPAADAMASVVTHELEEAVTDPDLNAWYDSRGYENADKCAWTFGAQQTAANGSKYNVTLSGKQYLIQQNWVNASGGYCAMSF